MKKIAAIVISMAFCLVCLNCSKAGNEKKTGMMDKIKNGLTQLQDQKTKDDLKNGLSDLQKKVKDSMDQTSKDLKKDTAPKK